MKKSRRILIALIPVLAGVAILAFMVSSKKPPARRGPQERKTPVRVIEAPVTDLVPRAVGYGYATPDTTWDAVAEVEGQVVEINPELKRGALLSRGDLLLRIDPAKRITADEQSQAEVRRLLAVLEDVTQQGENLRRKLDVEQRSLELAGQELERRRKLAGQEVIAPSELDVEEQQYLVQKNTVHELQNNLKLIPLMRRDVQAQLDKARSRLTETQIDLAKTEIRAPFDCRVRSEVVENGQAVRIGDVLAVLDSIGAVEVLAEIPLHAFRNILPPGASPLASGANMASLRAFLDLEAELTLRVGSRDVQWTGRVARVREELDPDARTVGVYVVVDDPYLKAGPGVRPPLLRNMYCKVVLRGRPRPGTVVLPRTAVRQGRVNLAGEDGRLIPRAVTVDFSQQDLAVIRSGLAGGESVVVSDLPYAVEGMLLAPVQDDALERRIIDQANGREEPPDEGRPEAPAENRP